MVGFVGVVGGLDVIGGIVLLRGIGRGLRVICGCFGGGLVIVVFGGCDRSLVWLDPIEFISSQ